MESQDASIKLSIVIPMYNEAENIGSVLGQIVASYGEAEIIVVDDGSTDGSADIVSSFESVKLIRHPYNIGNGAAVKTGIRAAQGEVILLMDGDGQHQVKDIEQLLQNIETYDMVVAARTAESDAAVHRTLANRFYNGLVSYLTGHKILDLTSGFRAIRTSVAKRYVYLLPNGFSYPTTITMALFQAGYTVKYVPVQTVTRKGKSKINLFKDGFGFLFIILRRGILFYPLKVFIPIALSTLVLGIFYSSYTIIWLHRFSNMGMLLVLSGLLIFLLGLVSDQVLSLRLSLTDLHYLRDD